MTLHHAIWQKRELKSLTFLPEFRFKISGLKRKLLNYSL